MNSIQQIKDKIKSFSFNDFLRYQKDIEKITKSLDLKPLKVAVLRSYTVEAIEPVLRTRLLLEGFQPDLFFGDYNQYVQEILDTSSALYKFQPDVILLMIRVEEVLPDFTENFADKEGKEWDNVITEKVNQFDSMAGVLEKNLSCQVLIQNLITPRSLYWGIYDIHTRYGQTFLIQKFNRELSRCLEARKTSFFWDFASFVKNYGYNNLYDQKMWYVSRNPYSQSSYPVMMDDMMEYLLSVLGGMKKCIVLDLDNTLWGGIAGEDGFDGIKLGHEYPGSCYMDFQKGLLRLYNRGIILAINSKNNEEDALEIIDNHPYMALRRKHFAAMRINWQDKVSNLRSLARDLNIGTDSMIFIDDNPVECELLQQFVPECEVICLPVKKPYLIPDVLKKLPGVENIKLTTEDRKKGSMYRSQIARKESESGFVNLDDFLKSLEMKVTIEPATSFSVPRIAQLTQKTNQMNLTTKRYTEANIQSFMKSPDSHVFSVAAKDRFGDHGIIGVFILKLQDGECLIDTFLLSCRVISRDIENTMIAFIFDFAKKQGGQSIIGEYIPTAKNQPAADMYDKFQFKRISNTLFQADLDQQTFEYPSYIKMNTPGSVTKSEGVSKTL
ncbi:MAG: HAD-IIIC family phosphatase [Desulfobacteraceae bacterium]|nr:HAD-IIIC family phosphatase [Desulfobacteraceae bacterium]MBC2754836.1 HAD-IIIC family phosphatase [Desulfobacteraceae bacterium]